MESASISQGTQDACRPLSFALKNPQRSLLSLVAYKAAPTQCFLTAPSETIQRVSPGRGRWIVSCKETASCTLLKAASSSSVHLTLLSEPNPAIALSRGEISDAQPGMTRLRTLTAPINDISLDTFSGGQQLDNVAIRCGLALSVPISHIYSRILVVLGAMTVLVRESFRLHFCRFAIIEEILGWVTTTIQVVS